MRGGFDYGDSSKVDWTSDVTWRFLRCDDKNDVYTVEWTFRPKRGASVTKAKEVSFDGSRGVGHLLRVRFNVRPEITVFRLERA